MEATAKLHSLSFNHAKTYGLAAAFIAGNLILPQICHLLPQGGLTWLPIYFFTLIATYKFGIRVGIITAVLSPLMNYLLFAMPPAAMLPVILFKSVTLAGAGAYAAKRFGKISLSALVLVVLSYQVVGGVFEGIKEMSLVAALQDFCIGFPGMLLQVFGGYAVLKWMARL